MQSDGKSEAPLVSERGFINPAASYSPTEKLCSTIGSGGLDFRVRDGIGYDPSDIATETCRSVQSHSENHRRETRGIRHEEKPCCARAGRAEPREKLTSKLLLPTLTSKTSYDSYLRDRSSLTAD